MLTKEEYKINQGLEKWKQRLLSKNFIWVGTRYCHETTIHHFMKGKFSYALQYSGVHYILAKESRRGKFISSIRLKNIDDITYLEKN